MCGISAAICGSFPASCGLCPANCGLCPTPFEPYTALSGPCPANCGLCPVMYMSYVVSCESCAAICFESPYICDLSPATCGLLPCSVSVPHSACNLSPRVSIQYQPVYKLSTTAFMPMLSGTTTHWHQQQNMYPLLEEHMKLMASASSCRDIGEIPAEKINSLFYLARFANCLWTPTVRADSLFARYKVIRHFYTRGGLLNFIRRCLHSKYLHCCTVIPRHFLSVLRIHQDVSAPPPLLADVLIQTTSPNSPQAADAPHLEIEGIPFSHRGGGQAYTFTEGDFLNFMVEDYADRLSEDDVYSFYAQVNSATAGALCEAHSNLIPVLIPFEKLVMKLTVGQIIACVKLHGPGMKFATRHIHVDAMREALRGHTCPVCPDLVTLLKPARRTAVKDQSPDGDVMRKKRIRTRPTAEPTKWVGGLLKCSPPSGHAEFPPTPCTEAEVAEIVTDFCRNQLPHQFEEVGCGI